MYSLCIWMYHWGGPIRQSPITSRLDHKAAFQLSGRGKASGFCGGSTVTQSNGQATGSKGAGKKKKTAHSNHLSSSSSQPAREGGTHQQHARDGRWGSPARTWLCFLKFKCSSSCCTHKVIPWTERVHADRDRRLSGYLLVAFPVLIMRNHALLSGSAFRVQTASWCASFVQPFSVQLLTH